MVGDYSLHSSLALRYRVCYYEVSVATNHTQEITMHIEHALAARKIANMLAQGYSRECAIAQAAKLVKSQGFGLAYSKQVAAQMGKLV